MGAVSDDYIVLIVTAAFNRTIAHNEFTPAVNKVDQISDLIGHFSHYSCLLFMCSTVLSFHHLVSLYALSAAMPLAFGPASLMPRSGSATLLLCCFYVARSERGFGLWQQSFVQVREDTSSSF